MKTRQRCAGLRRCRDGSTEILRIALAFAAIFLDELRGRPRRWASPRNGHATQRQLPRAARLADYFKADMKPRPVQETRTSLSPGPVHQAPPPGWPRPAAPGTIAKNFLMGRAFTNPRHSACTSVSRVFSSCRFNCSLAVLPRCAAGEKEVMFLANIWLAWIRARLRTRVYRR